MDIVLMNSCSTILLLSGSLRKTTTTQKTGVVADKVMWGCGLVHYRSPVPSYDISDVSPVALFPTDGSRPTGQRFKLKGHSHLPLKFSGLFFFTRNLM